MTRRLTGKSNKIESFAKQGREIRGRGWKLVLAAAGLAALGMTFAPQGAYALPTCPVSKHISNCCQITVPGSYDILGNFTASIGSGACIDILATDVSLSNANGNVTGPGSGTPTIGVHVESTAARASLSGCFIFCSGGAYNGFGTGVQMDAAGTTIGFVGANGNGTGMVVNGSGLSAFFDGANSNIRNGLVINSTAVGPEIQLFGADSNGKSGVKLNQVQGGFLSSVIASSNNQYGIWLNGAQGVTLTNFTADSDLLVGIYLGCHGDFATDSVPCPVGTPATKGNMLIQTGSGTTATTNANYGLVIDTGNRANRVSGVSAVPNNIEDFFDGNNLCASNLWTGNTFISSNRSCIH